MEVQINFKNLNMQTPHYTKIHNRFLLNGFYYNHEGLKEVAYSFIKEGDFFERFMGDFLMDWLDQSDSISIETSGTTALPKRMLYKKQALVNSAIATGDFFDVTVGDKALHCLPANFIAGKMMVVRALSLGLDLWVSPPSNHPLDFFKTTFDFVAMVPSQLEASISLLNCCRKVLIGGAPLIGSLKRKAVLAVQTEPTELFLSYGMTETLSHIAIAKLTLEDQVIFSLLPHIHIKENDRGCLSVIAPYISHDTIHTTDIVRILDASHFEWLGRLDFVINSGGVKIHPESLEKAHEKYFSFPFFYSGIPHDLLGEQLVIVVAQEYLKESQEILAKIQFGTKFYKPKGILTVAEFLYTHTFKLRRKDTLGLGYKVHDL